MAGVRGSLAETADAGEDGAGALGPHQEPRVRVGRGDVSADGVLQLFGAGEDAAREPAAGQHSEPALDEVELGGQGRGEVRAEAAIRLALASTCSACSLLGGRRETGRGEHRPHEVID